MRLNRNDIKGILKGIGLEVPLDRVQIYLFGSRTKESLKGGDIDLLIVFSDIESKKIFTNKKFKILASIYREIGEQKIDLHMCNQADLTEDEFYSEIIKNALEIKRDGAC